MADAVIEEHVEERLELVRDLDIFACVSDDLGGAERPCSLVVMSQYRRVLGVRLMWLTRNISSLYGTLSKVFRR